VEQLGELLGYAPFTSPGIVDAYKSAVVDAE
jgi:hypothetical protein